MSSRKWNVAIRGGGPSFQDSLFIYREFDAGTVEILQFDRQGVSIKRCDRGAAGEPTAMVDAREMREIVEGFVEYARSQGFKSADESYAKGKLEAVENHLADMQKLVFSKK